MPLRRIAYNKRMNLHELTEKVLHIEALYAERKKETSAKQWTAEETYAGMVSDMGDLGRLVLAKEGFREMPDTEKNLPHELAELLYAILLLANRYNIDLSKAFLDEIARLQQRLSK